MGIKLVKYGVYASNDNGVISHDKLKDRDLNNQHPINAIEGLSEILDGIHATKHQHENKLILDEFSENIDGNLLYKNKPINGSNAAQIIEIPNITTTFEIGDLICYNKEIKKYQKANGMKKESRDVIGVVIKFENQIATVQISGLFLTDLFRYYEIGDHLYLSNYIDGKTTSDSNDAYVEIGVKVEQGILIKITNVEIKNLSELEIQSILNECFNTM